MVINNGIPFYLYIKDYDSLAAIFELDKDKKFAIDEYLHQNGIVSIKLGQNFGRDEKLARV